MYCANLDHFLIRWSPDVYEGTYYVDQVMIAKTISLPDCHVRQFYLLATLQNN